MRNKMRTLQKLTSRSSDIFGEVVACDVPYKAEGNELRESELLVFEERSLIATSPLDSWPTIQEQQVAI